VQRIKLASAQLESPRNSCVSERAFVACPDKFRIAINALSPTGQNATDCSGLPQSFSAPEYAVLLAVADAANAEAATTSAEGSGSDRDPPRASE